MEKQAGKKSCTIWKLSFPTVTAICFTLQVLALAAGAAAYGQSTFGEIHGVVRDVGGLPLPSMQVVLHGVEGDADLTVVSGGDGVFVAKNLAPGHYRLTARKEGVGSAPATTVELAAGQSLHYDMTLSSPNGSKESSGLASPVGTGNSDRTSLTEREKRLLDRIERLEQRLAAMEAKDANGANPIATSTLPVLASLDPAIALPPAENPNAL